MHNIFSKLIRNHLTVVKGVIRGGVGGKVNGSEGVVITPAAQADVNTIRALVETFPPGALRELTIEVSGKLLRECYGDEEGGGIGKTQFQLTTSIG